MDHDALVQEPQPIVPSYLELLLEASDLIHVLAGPVPKVCVLLKCSPEYSISVSVSGKAETKVSGILCRNMVRNPNFGLFDVGTRNKGSGMHSRLLQTLSFPSAETLP